MLNYRIYCQQDDGSWSMQNFQSADDPDAISYGLSVRTANRCELYQGDRWLATFDGVPEENVLSANRANRKRAERMAEMETEEVTWRREGSREAGA